MPTSDTTNKSGVCKHLDVLVIDALELEATLVTAAKQENRPLCSNHIGYALHIVHIDCNSQQECCISLTNPDDFTAEALF